MTQIPDSELWRAFVASRINMAQLIELSFLLALASKALAIPRERLKEELHGLLTGRVGPQHQIAKALGFTRAELDQARVNGRLFDSLATSLACFAN